MEKGLENARKKAIRDFHKNYPQTVSENVDIFYSYLNLLTKYDVKAIVVVLPGFGAYNKEVPARINEKFIRIIEKAKKKCDFQFLDYFRSSLFNDEDFFDGSHLSNKGAVKFTKIFNEDVDW